jgi:penicillin-binding protein 1A
MNVPSLKVLNDLGFDDAIEITSRLLNIDERDQVARGLVRRYPIGLGVISVSPVMMAQAFATFPNQGRRVTPVFVRYVEDRTGRIVAEPERQLREEQARMGRELQLISPQTAYIMTDMLQSTVEYGTLANRRRLVGGFGDMPSQVKPGPPRTGPPCGPLASLPITPPPSGSASTRATTPSASIRPVRLPPVPSGHGI